MRTGLSLVTPRSICCGCQRVGPASQQKTLSSWLPRGGPVFVPPILWIWPRWSRRFGREEVPMTCKVHFAAIVKAIMSFVVRREARSA